MKTLESVETYLETILILGQGGKPVRSVDIANALDYSRPSISNAMKNLRQKAYIEINETGYITLTDTGNAIAQTMYERHTWITEWLISLGVDSAIAAGDACRMEHVMSEESFNAIKTHAIQNHVVLRRIEEPHAEKN